MKKVISVLLAILMVFSITTVAFAEGEPAQDPEVVAGEGDAAADDGATTEIPDWVIKVGLKVGPKLGKVILKIVATFVSLAISLGLIDSDELLGQIQDAINGMVNPPADETPADAPAAA